jgi:feruloyl esterase
MRKSFLGTFTVIAITITSMMAVSLLLGCSKDQETSQKQSKEKEPALQQKVSASPVCEKKSFPPLPDVTISTVTSEAVPVPHCKVAGVIGLLPEKWNGKFVMGGGGGFVGSVMNTSLMYGSLQAGYATVGTDTGHQGHPVDASWALNNQERLVNFGYRAVHQTAVTSKALIKAYYQNNIARSYFTGCSRGGGQGLMEAQRYPEDFDGVVAGTYAIDWTRIAVQATQISRAMYPDPNNLQEAVVGPKEQELIESSYLTMCDEQDGIKDGILNDPRQCKFDVATLLCKGKKTDSCLSEQQLAAVKVIYDGPKDSKGNSLYYGFPFGGETALGGWSRWLTGGLKYQADLDEFQGGVDTGDFEAPVSPSAFYSFGNDIMKYFIYNDPDWTYVNYNYDNFKDDAKQAAEILNATNPDLSEFRKRGGKMILYSGWSDNAQSGLAMVGYYENVLAYDKTAVNDARLFMMPGVEHCFGGPGPSWVNYLTEIDKWFESGKAPEQITAYWVDEKMQPTGARPVCAYPKVARYDGKGDTRDAASFSCVEQN